jgi:hypothetical protein
MFDIKQSEYYPEALVEEKLNVLLDYLKSLIKSLKQKYSIKGDMYR